jgi:hypothetical protein
MPYGKLDEVQQELVQSAVTGQVVLDLGAGDLTLAKELIRLGARKVIAVDKHGFEEPGPSIETVEAYFADFLADHPGQRFNTAFLSWPANNQMPGLLDLLRACDRVIYLGCNTSGTACGWPGLFEYLMTRKLDGYVPRAQNSLMLYSAPVIEPRLAVGEELAGRSAFMGTVYDFELKARSLRRVAIKGLGLEMQGVSRALAE